MSEIELLELLRAELRKRLAETITPIWQSSVMELAKRADREIEVVLAFGRMLDTVFEAVRRFPGQYTIWRDGKVPSQSLPPSLPAGGAPRVSAGGGEDGDEEPWRLMKEDEHEKIIAQTTERDPAFRKMLGSRLKVKSLEEKRVGEKESRNPRA